MGNYVNNLTEKVKLLEKKSKFLSKTLVAEKTKLSDKVVVSIQKNPKEKVKLKETITKVVPYSRTYSDQVSLHESSLITPKFGSRAVCEVWYGGYKFLPAPLISVQRQLVRSRIRRDIVYKNNNQL